MTEHDDTGPEREDLAAKGFPGARTTAGLAAYTGFVAFLLSGEYILHLLCPT